MAPSRAANVSCAGRPTRKDAARMAELRVEGGELVLRLSALEKVGGVHGDLRAPRDAGQTTRAGSRVH